MLSRYSVKKPYTVVVAVVLVIILGVVSFTKMNTDLLPSMNLPYAVVMTTYAGANPETVEMVVTKPVEQSMATVSNIENISSVSRENMSLVILEFAESANMDSVPVFERYSSDVCDCLLDSAECSGGSGVDVFFWDKFEYHFPVRSGAWNWYVGGQLHCRN